MVIIDGSRTNRRRDLLLRQSSSSSSVFLKAAANKTTKNAPQQLRRCDSSSSRNTRRRDLLSRQYSSSSNVILRKDVDSETTDAPLQLRRSTRRRDLLSRQSSSSSSKISKAPASRALDALQQLHLDTAIDKRPHRRGPLLLRQSSSSSNIMFLRKAAAAKTPKPQRRDSSASTSRSSRRRDSSSSRCTRRRDLLLRQESSLSTATVETMRSLKVNKSEDGGIIGSEIICIEIFGGEVQPPVSRSSRVYFSPEYECVYIARRTESETTASFYSQEDLKRIEADTFGTILEMDIKKKYPSSETQYHRGLLTARAQYQKKQRTKFVVSQVLKEQERNKTLSEEWVKAFSKKFSTQTTTAAFYLGKIDAKAAGATDTLSTHSYLRSLQKPKASRGKVIWI